MKNNAAWFASLVHSIRSESGKLVQRRNHDCKNTGAVRLRTWSKWNCPIRKVASERHYKEPLPGDLLECSCSSGSVRRDNVLSHSKKPLVQSCELKWKPCRDGEWRKQQRDWHIHDCRENWIKENHVSGLWKLTLKNVSHGFTCNFTYKLVRELSF